MDKQLTIEEAVILNQKMIDEYHYCAPGTSYIVLQE